jgi:hypothetical protein
MSCKMKLYSARGFCALFFVSGHSIHSTLNMWFIACNWKYLTEYCYFNSSKYQWQNIGLFYMTGCWTSVLKYTVFTVRCSFQFRHFANLYIKFLNNSPLLCLNCLPQLLVLTYAWDAYSKLQYLKSWYTALYIYIYIYIYIYVSRCGICICMSAVIIHAFLFV